MTREEKIKKAAFEYADTEPVGIIDFKKEAAFIEGATWADTHPHWISVEDELPPKESEYDDNSIVVLVTDGNGVYKGLYRRDEYLSGWFTCDLWALDNITHWMPLPSIETIKNKNHET